MTKEEAKHITQFAQALIRWEDPRSTAKNSWGRVWVEAEKAIPENLRSEFYEELCSEDESYRKKLEDSVRWFGVRYE